MTTEYGVIIIGAGIVGTAAARELGRFSSTVLLLEKGRDVSVGATKANSGIIHGGYSSKAGSLKAELSLRGNRMYPQLSRELGFPYYRTGSYVLAFHDQDREILHALLSNGLGMGEEQLELHTPSQVFSREPRVSREVKEGLWCSDAGIASPYEAAVAFAEHAASNGVTLKLRHEVSAIEFSGRTFKVTCCVPYGDDAVFSSPVILNTAGLYSDTVSNMVGIEDFLIRPRKGEYLLLSRGSAEGFKSVLFQAPGVTGKGILVSPTTWGNLIIGPNAQDSTDRENLGSNFDALSAILQQARISVPSLTLSSLIRVFSGLRPSSDKGDFIIGRTQIPGFFQASGIESPGLTSAPAIAEMIRRQMQEDGFLGIRKQQFQTIRRPITTPGPLQNYREIKEFLDLPEGNPQRLVCRCEQVSEKTIIDALTRGIPIDSLDAVKRRTRAGMGACQGTFCRPRVTELVKRVTGLSEKDIELPVPKDRTLMDELKKL